MSPANHVLRASLVNHASPRNPAKRASLPNLVKPPLPVSQSKCAKLPSPVRFVKRKILPKPLLAKAGSLVSPAKLVKFVNHANHVNPAKFGMPL
ncbi:MAG: hypothetical protein EOP11_15635, partial [Proteobacteria bacterium]